MQAIMSLGMGYLIGCISPAAWIGKKKHVDLTEEGTKNLGATNAALVLGRAAGVFVMVFDILKSYFAAKMAKIVFPHLALAGLIASFGTIVGHCFPVFMDFRGGKGLAAFGGMILAYNPRNFVQIVISGLIAMTLLNTGVAAPVLGCILFPILVWLKSKALTDTLLAAAACVFVFVMHWPNVKKAIAGEDFISTRGFYKNILFKRNK